MTISALCLGCASEWREGTPSVAYTGDGALPWQLAYTLGTPTVFPMRKGPSPQDAWSMSGVTPLVMQDAPQATSPAVGSRYYSGGDRRYIVTQNAYNFQ